MKAFRIFLLLSTGVLLTAHIGAEIVDISIFDGKAPTEKSPGGESEGEKDGEEASNGGGVPTEDLEDFKSTEKIPADASVAFPIDI